MPSAPRVAKLSVPRAAAAPIRPRLQRLRDAAVARGAAFIAAGPGAGKRILAVTWATPRAGRLLWSRADEDDRDPAEAFGHFRELAGHWRAARALPAFRPRDVATTSASMRPERRGRTPGRKSSRTRRGGRQVLAQRKPGWWELQCTA
jgi:hypothetical protein